MSLALLRDGEYKLWVRAKQQKLSSALSLVMSLKSYQGKLHLYILSSLHQFEDSLQVQFYNDFVEQAIRIIF
jgi:hypothetical protein